MSYKLNFLVNLCLAAVFLGLFTASAQDGGNVTESTHPPLPAVILPNETTTHAAVDTTQVNSTEARSEFSTPTTEVAHHTEPTTVHHTEPTTVHHTEPTTVHHTEPTTVHHTEPTTVHHLTDGHANVTNDPTADATHQPSTTTTVPEHSGEGAFSVSTPVHGQHETSTGAPHSKISTHQQPSHGGASSNPPEHHSTSHNTDHSTSHSTSHSTGHSSSHSSSTQNGSVSAVKDPYDPYSWWKIVVALTIFCGMAGIILIILKGTESSSCKKSKIKDEDLSTIEEGSDTTLNEKMSTSRV